MLYKFTQLNNLFTFKVNENLQLWHQTETEKIEEKFTTKLFDFENRKTKRTFYHKKVFYDVCDVKVTKTKQIGFQQLRAAVLRVLMSLRGFAGLHQTLCFAETAHFVLSFTRSLVILRLFYEH